MEHSKGKYLTYTVFNLQAAYKLWGFAQMGKGLPSLPSLAWAKLLGCGKGIGFSLLPDWNRYVLLACWHSMEEAEEFFSSQTYIENWRQRCSTFFHFILEPIQAHGLWAGEVPFILNGASPIQQNEPLAVITRGTIRWNSLFSFAAQAKGVTAQLGRAEGRLFSMGAGELPLREQLTFSVWNSLDDMRAFAYKQGEHQQEVAKNKKRSFFKEDMFIRCRVLGMAGL